MLRFLVPLIFVLSTVTSLREILPQRRRAHAAVASESQIKFAIENKYDDTGPGAKQPQYAYNTYKTLEDALIAYLDDPDTKLPEHERVKAINKLIKSQQYQTLPELGRLFHKDGQFSQFQPPKLLPLNHEAEAFNFPGNKIFYSEDGKFPILEVKGIDGNEVLRHYPSEKKLEPFKFQKLHSVKGNPLSLAHYTRDPDVKAAYEQFDSHPKYTFSYGVHDKTTGDSKQAQESRDGGNVHGFYSFIGADGQTHIVHYTANDRQGYRANVKKIHKNI